MQVIPQLVQGVLDMLSLFGEDMAIALAGGTDLVIPIEQYAAAVTKDKEFAALIANDRRLTADGFTVRELDQWTRGNESALRDALEASLQEGERQGRMERETKEIHFAVRQQLEATGVPRDQAAANATQMAVVFGTLAQRTGKSPLELWKAYALDVAREGGLTVEAEEMLPVGETRPAAMQAVNIAYQQEGAPEIVGRITPELAANFPLQKQGDILLDDAGLAHIEEEHGQQIRAAGFADARGFVNYVLQNVDAVYLGKSSRSFQLVVRDANPYKQAVIRLEFSESEDFYRVATAGPERHTYFREALI